MLLREFFLILTEFFGYFKNRTGSFFPSKVGDKKICFPVDFLLENGRKIGYN